MRETITNEKKSSQHSFLTKLRGIFFRKNVFFDILRFLTKLPHGLRAEDIPAGHKARADTSS
jgi:hypothetical protein